MAVAPNDQLIATASQDKTIRLWSMPDLVQVRRLRRLGRLDSCGGCGCWGSVRWSSLGLGGQWLGEAGLCYHPRIFPPPKLAVYRIHSPTRNVFLVLFNTGCGTPSAFPWPDPLLPLAL